MKKLAFTLVELLVVVAIIIALLAILLPSMGEAVALAQQASCLAGQRQIGVAGSTYASDHFGVFPYNVSHMPSTPTNRSGWVGWRESRDLWVDYVSDNTLFYCPSTEGGANLPTRSTQATFASGTTAGWDAIPFNVPANYYVWTDYAFFPNFHRTESGRRLNYLFGPDEIGEVADPDATAMKYPRRLADLDERSADTVPMLADWVWSRYIDSIEDSQARGPKNHNANDGTFPSEWAVGHSPGPNWRGLGVTFMDGSGTWRTRDEAAPRINVNVGALTHTYGHAYWY